MNANEIIQLMGLLYFIFGLAFVVHRIYYMDLFKDLLASKTFKFTWGSLSLVLGFVLILYFHEYTLSKEWLVSVVWIISFLKWLFLILFPELFWRMNKVFTRKKYFSLVWFSVIVISILLLYLWFLG